MKAPCRCSTRRGQPGGALAAGLGLGCVAAGRFLWSMGWGGHHYDRATWLLWLLLLVGPLVLGGFYLVQLVRCGPGAD